MRTTLTIDDVASKLKIELQKEKGKTFKDIINETLRRGLLAKKAIAEAELLKLKTYSLKLAKSAENTNFDDIGGLIERIERADF